MWYPESDVVLDCIDSYSLTSFLFLKRLTLNLFSLTNHGLCFLAQTLYIHDALACYSELKLNIAEPYTCLEFITPSASLNIYTFIKFVKKYVIQNQVRYHKVDLE